MRCPSKFVSRTLPQQVWQQGRPQRVQMPVSQTCWQVVGAQAHLYQVPNLKALLAILYILEVEAPAAHQCAQHLP
jgi:hypothetical protein